MGLYKRENGVFYLSLTINKKRIYKSLQTKGKVFAKDLYHVLLREQILQSFFPSSSDTNSQVLPTPIEIKQDIRKTRSINHAIDRYMKNCESRNLGNRR